MRIQKLVQVLGLFPAFIGNSFRSWQILQGRLANKILDFSWKIQYSHFPRAQNLRIRSFFVGLQRFLQRLRAEQRNNGHVAFLSFCSTRSCHFPEDTGQEKTESAVDPFFWLHVLYLFLCLTLSLPPPEEPTGAEPLRTIKLWRSSCKMILTFWKLPNPTPCASLAACVTVEAWVITTTYYCLNPIMNPTTLYSLTALVIFLHAPFSSPIFATW